MKVELLLTEDGSHTLFVPGLKEVYHSRFGALAESRHVFIASGLGSFTSRDQVSILEVGFGTGLNAFLTLTESGKLKMSVDYTAIEAFPVEEAVYSLLNFPEIAGIPEKRESFIVLHTTPWNEKCRICPGFQLLKRDVLLQNHPFVQETYDLIYFDAFGPEVQPELWTEEIFRKMARSLKPGGILITYSAKGSVRRAMKAAGLTVEKLPGPAGKREITRAKKEMEKDES